MTPVDSDFSCPCGSQRTYAKCCGPFHEGHEIPPSPEALMRSRYSAFALNKPDYLEETTDPQTRERFDFGASADWARQARFQRLEVLEAGQDGNKGFVEFKAYYMLQDKAHCHHEKSRFRKQAGQWFYREGKVIPVEPAPAR